MATSLRTAFADAKASQVPIADARPSLLGVVAIGRIEAKRMVLHPTFWVSFIACSIMIRSVIGGGGEASLGKSVLVVTAALLIGLFLGTILSANVASVRPRRDHMRELFGSLPSPPETRTVGLFAGLAFGPFLLSLLFTSVSWWLLKHTSDPDIHPEEIDGFLAVQVPLAIFCVGSIAIAAGRWVPSLFGGPVIIVVHLFTGLIWLVPWIMPRSSKIDATWHLVYLAAAITTWVALALARDRRTVWRLAVVGLAVALGVTAAIQQRPPGGF
ncbi:MAG: hypothetical protein ABJB55_09975 [Actinomycetota bacterium]